MQEVFSAIRFQHKAPASPSSSSPAADLLMTAHAKLVSENAALNAHVQASQRGLDGSAARLAELEALNDDLRALTNSLQIRLEKASDDLVEAKAENKRLKSLVQEADHAGFELERQAILLTESQQKIRDQEDRIAQLLAEIKELKTQVKHLTKQLEMAVEDLETEAKQTERFTNTFFDWSQRFNDINGDSDGSVQHTGASRSAQHSFC